MKGTSHLSFGLATSISTVMIMDQVFTDPYKMCTFVSGAALGSLLVDIDNDNSTIGRDLKPISTIICKIFGHRQLIHAPLFVLLFYFVFNYLFNTFYNSNIRLFQEIYAGATLICVLLSFISNLKDNKGFKKSILFALFIIGVSTICLYNLQFALYGTIFGMIGHLILDMMTKKGIPLIYPFKLPIKYTEAEKRAVENGHKVKRKLQTPYLSLLPLKSGTGIEIIVAFILYCLYFYLLINYNEKAISLGTYNIITIIKSLL